MAITVVALLSIAVSPACMAQSGVPMQQEAEKVFGGGSRLALPDGTVPTPWEKPAQPARTYHVDQNHPNAADTNDGSAGVQEHHGAA